MCPQHDAHPGPRGTLPNVTAVRHVGGHRLRVHFDDGIEGEVELATIVELTGDFAPLRDPAYVARAQVNRDLGTIVWPNGAELDPVVLYQAARIGGDTRVPLRRRSIHA
jgi:hypothetical protein